MSKSKVEILLNVALVVVVIFSMYMIYHNYTSPSVERHVDPEWNVVCYHKTFAIDCLPLEDLNIDY